MQEVLRALTVLWCAMTYWLGGQEIPGIKRGFLFIRRFILPAGLFILLIALHAIIWQAVLGCILLCVSLHLGYKDKLWRFALTGFLMGCAAVLPFALGHNFLYALIPCFSHTLFGWISLKWNKFDWCYVAVLQGAFVGLTFLLAFGV